MKRAITILQDLLTYEEEAKAKVEIRKAIAELKATQAKLDNLRDYCNSAYVSYPDGYKFALGYIQARKEILTKLEQGSKEQRRK